MMDPELFQESNNLEFDFAESDLLALLAGPMQGLDEDNAEDQVEPSEELHELARRLSGQYIEVIGGFVRTVFASAPGAAQGAASSVLSALDNLLRLADQTGDQALHRGLEDICGLLRGELPTNRRDHNRFLGELKDRVLDFAALLQPDDAEQLRGLVTFQRQAQPLLDELASIRGIGPKRLERLYCAGLFTVEAVRSADPKDIADVTGLPRSLAERVSQATQDFAERQRRDAVEQLILHAQRFARQASTLRVEVPEDADLIGRAQVALDVLSSALRAFKD